MRIFPISLSYQAVVSGRLSHPAANPLRLTLRMRDGESLAAPCVLRAELHTSRFISANTTPLAVATAAASPFQSEWNLDFTSAQMNQPTPPEGVRKLWLVVYATEGSTILYTFAGLDVDLGWHAISQATPPPPYVPLVADVGGRGWQTGWQYEAETLVVNGTTPYVSLSAHTSSAATEPGVGVDWETVWQAAASGSGDVVGPASATDNALARFDGTTGKLIQNSTATLSDAGALTVTDATVSGTLTASHIHGNLAGSVYTHVRNESGSAIAKGTPVYVTGFSVGHSLSLVGRADSSSAATMPAIGILDAELANNASGHCVITGIIENLDTSGLAVNAPLYVASGGGLTATAPDVRAQPIAIVERVNVNNGAIIVTPAATNGSLASQSAASVSITGGSIGGTTSINTTGSLTAAGTVSFTSATAGAVSTSADITVNGVRVGRGAGSAVTLNMACGSGALANNTTGTGNTAGGASALGANTEGLRNTAFGTTACGRFSAVNSDMAAFGYDALANITTASGTTTALGSEAGRFFSVTGSPNLPNLNNVNSSVFVGYRSRPLNNGSTNQIVIGANAVGDGNNTTVIGTPSTTQSRLYGGNALTTGANGQSTHLGQSTVLLTGLTGATRTATALIPANSIVIGVTARVTTAITGATSFDIGDGTTANLFGDDVAAALDTTSNNTIAPTRYATATNVVLTANGGNFTAGAVRLTVHFITLVAPTS